MYSKEITIINRSILVASSKMSVLLIFLFFSCPFPVFGIVNGQSSCIHDVPFAVQLLGQKLSSNWESAGAGVLVHPAFVLTSAMCKR